MYKNYNSKKQNGGATERFLEACMEASATEQSKIFYQKLELL